MDASYIKSARLPHQLPPPEGPEVAAIGRSNSGKSSLLNALFGTKKLVKTSATAGHTQMINFFRLRALGGELQFADLPGYGYSATGKAVREPWGALVEAYFARQTPKRYLFLSDARRALDDQDQEILAHLAREAHSSLSVVLTKSDKLKQSEIQRAKVKVEASLDSFGVRPASLHVVSSLKGTGIEALRRELFDWRAGLDGN